MSARPLERDELGDVFRHEALLYAGEDDFVEHTSRFLLEGVERDEPALVVVSAAKIDRLRSELGAAAEAVHFADMADVGHNPARIIPAWRQFLTERSPDGRPVRGIGEPIWAGRSDAELVECERHEALLNVAFNGGSAWRLLCPYDTESLPDAVIEEARRNHPFVLDRGRPDASATYSDDAFAAPFVHPLPEPPVRADELAFGSGPLDEVRSFVARHALAFGLGAPRTSDLVLAVNEVATNSVRHGGGRGVVRAWSERDALIFEIRDGGHIDEPLVGRTRPAREQEGGRGLWIVNQLCDLVQVRSSPEGTTIRVHVTSGA